MKFQKVLLLVTLAASLAVNCGKKSSNTSNTSSTSATTQAADVAGAYSAIAASTAKLNVTGYTGSPTSLALASGLEPSDPSSLELTEASWTSEDWNTSYFNCFNKCPTDTNGNVTSDSGKQYVADALNKSNSGPMGTVQQLLGPVCYVGAMLPSSAVDASGLPINGTYTVTLNSTITSALKTNCGMTDSMIAGISAAGSSLSITIAASTSTLFDRQVTFSLTAGGQNQTFSTLLKNSGGKIAVGIRSNTGTAASGNVTAAMLTQDLTTGIFRMEYFARDYPGASATEVGASNGIVGGSYSFYRGFYDKTTGEIRFFSNMGNSYHQMNNTWMGMSGNDNEATAGAYLARTSQSVNASTGATQDDPGLAGAFVCFTKADGTWINNTGCTENAANNRKAPWSPTSTMWMAVNGKTFSDWGTSPTDVPAFDATTMFTLEPNYK